MQPIQLDSSATSQYCEFWCSTSKQDDCVADCHQYMQSFKIALWIIFLGFLVLTVMIAVFVAHLCYKGKKLSAFSWTQLFLLTTFCLISVLREFLSHTVQFMQIQMLDGVNIVLFANISLNFAIRYFYSANIIYQFSINGHLPTQKKSFRFKVGLILFNLISFIGGMTFVFVLDMFLMEQRMGRAMTAVFIGTSLLLLVNVATIVILGKAISRLVKSRAKACDPGQLSRSMLLVMLCLMVSFTVFQTVCNLNYFRLSYLELLSACAVLFNYLILCYLFLFMLATCDLHEFVPKTILRCDNKIELIAVGLNGNQLFSFMLDENLLNQHPNPLEMNKSKNFENSLMLSHSNDTMSEVTDREARMTQKAKMLQQEGTTSIFIEQFKGNGAYQSRVSRTSGNNSASRPETKEIGSNRGDMGQKQSQLLTEGQAKSLDVETNFSLNLNGKQFSSANTINREARYTMQDARILNSTDQFGSGLKTIKSK